MSTSSTITSVLMQRVGPKTTAGAITIAIGGFATMLTVGDAREWLSLMQEYLPLVMLLAQGGVIYHIAKQHEGCQAQLTKLHEQMRATYSLVRQSVRADDDLPDVDAFARGDYDQRTIDRALARREVATKKTGRRKADKPAKPRAKPRPKPGKS
jgi:hypothetical protein